MTTKRFTRSATTSSTAKRFDVSVNAGTSYWISRGSFDTFDAARRSAEEWRAAIGPSGRWKITDEIGREVASS